MRKRGRQPPDFGLCDCNFWKKCGNQACYDNKRNTITINPRFARKFPKVLDLVNHETTHWAMEMYLDRREIRQMAIAMPESTRAYRKYLPERIANEVEDITRVKRRVERQKVNRG